MVTVTHNRQNNILAVYESVDLNVPGSPALVLSDYAYFVTLAFSETVDQTTPTIKQDSVSLAKRATYIAMCKRIMPLLSHLYSRFKGNVELYSDGTVEAILKVCVQEQWATLLITSTGIRDSHKAQV